MLIGEEIKYVALAILEPCLFESISKYDPYTVLLYCMRVRQPETKRMAVATIFAE